MFNLNRDDIRFRKVSIHDDHCLTIEFLMPVEDSQKEDECSLKLHHIMHDDLKELFKKLAVHMALATEYITQPLIKLNSLKQPYDTQAGHDLFKPFMCRQLSQSWSEKRPGMVITGIRRLENKRVVSINTPFIESDPDKSGYPYINELLNIVKLFEDEVFEYLTGEKFAVKQAELQEQE